MIMDLFQDKDIILSGEHVREGLTCIISVRVPNPEFEGQTKVLSIRKKIHELPCNRHLLILLSLTFNLLGFLSITGRQG